MFNVFMLTALFCFTTAASVILIGTRNIVGGEMNSIRIIQIIFSWQFILGAFFALASRMVFLLINNTLYKIPDLSNSSTTVTTFITSFALVVVAIANYFFLHERFSGTQIVGGAIILLGIIIITR